MWFRCDGCQKSMSKAEALRKLYVEEMPLVVIIDSEGNNLYEDGRKAYLAQHK